MAVKIPPVMTVLSGASQWLAQKPGMALRILVLMGVWGLVVFGWSSLGEWALVQRLPPFYTAARMYGEAVAGAMQQQLIALTALAEDARLSAGMASEDGMESLDIRRALYEFGYINRVTQLYLVDEASRGNAQLAGSRPLPNEVREWLGGLDGKSPAMMAVGLPEEPLLYVAVKVPDAGSYAYIVMPWSAEQWLAAMPTTPYIDAYPETTGMLVTEVAGTIWGLPQRGRPVRVEGTARLGVQSFTGMDGTVVIMGDMPGVDGWGVALTAPSSITMGSSRLAQLGVVLAGLLITFAVMWRPMRPVRQKVLTKLQPVMQVVMPLAAPVLASISSIVRNERAVDTRNLPQPGDFTDAVRSGPMTQSSWPQRVNVQRTGGNAFAKPKRQVAGVGAGLTKDTKQEPVEALALAELPEKPTSELTPDELTLLVDECLTLGRSQLLYQPIYKVSTGLPVMHEVLLRLIDRDGKQMTPGMFIPICEREGWLDRLDGHVAEKVLQLHFADGSAPESLLSLNISGGAMDSLGYVEKLMTIATPQILQKLVFEVRSAELVRDPKAMTFLRECRDMGVRLSVDYFGGGVETIETCKRIGFDFIKMDALRFSADESSKKSLIVLCRAAQRLYLPVVLERMETVAMEVFARRVGVAYLQGYLLGKPKEEMVNGPLPGWREMMADQRAPAAPATVDGVGLAGTGGGEAPPALPGSDVKP